MRRPHRLAGLMGSREAAGNRRDRADTGRFRPVSSSGEVKRRWSCCGNTGRSREVLTPKRKAPPKRGQVCQGTLMRLAKASRCRPYRDRLLLSPRDKKKPRRRQRGSLSLTGSAPIMTRVSRSTRSRSASITISMQPARLSSSPPVVSRVKSSLGGSAASFETPA